ncbi:MAG TPA: ABC transporter substrate-binding protein [Dehalococcoidia bacterium]|nr:ABC transporter substrate-binding protein [Dehalococcoidia bacterium]
MKRLLLPALALLLLPLAFACSSGESSNRIRVQLDWTPNTNHFGIYVALAQGWYKDAGLDVQVLPYIDVNPDLIVANGKADVGISFPANVIFSRASGLDVVSVAGVLQRSVTELAVLDSSSIQRPRDLDGKTYAGFGLPFEQPMIKSVITADGGKGDFKSVTLSTAAYEALYNGRADFTEIYTTWEGIEAQLRGVKLRTFRYDQYGVPDFPGVLLIASRSRLDKDEAKLRRFLEVTRRGYEFAAQQPQAAAQLMLDYLPHETFPEPEQVRRSADLIAQSFLAPDGHWGTQDPAKWNAYTNWLQGAGVVTDARGNVVRDIRAEDLYTNRLLQSTGQSP